MPMIVREWPVVSVSVISGDDSGSKRVEDGRGERKGDGDGDLSKEDAGWLLDWRLVYGGLTLMLEVEWRESRGVDFGAVMGTGLAEVLLDGV